MEIPEKVNLSQVVTERIKTHILEEGLKEGDKLPSEKQLIESLRVSRTVVREALKSLETVGLIKIKPGDGIYVDGASLKPVLDQVSFRWKREDRIIKELLQTRRILELGAVELAIELYDLRLIGEMDIWIREMEARIKKGELPIEEDLQFHRALFRSTGNETYCEFSEVLNNFFIKIRESHFGNVEDTKKSLEEHRNIVRYIREKNTESAKAEMERHLVPLKKYVGG
ncbi:MAG: GntR family transcriptional regulator [Paenibacillus sp.]|uniref:FadR/GntR family transcriptional regulator n=1 Tax=unclassified Paenibacillus TaxID=185978 RepID=UPI0029EA76A5|nr:GntR family transcriptional regulator [Paenibacillus sp.]